MRKTWSSLALMIALSCNRAYAVDTEIAPTGKFRVGMNANNSPLVTRNADGTVSGLSADLGRFISGKLGVTCEPVV